MFELADYLVGIYKVQDCTHSVTVMNEYKEKEFGTGKENEENQNTQKVLESSSSQIVNKSVSQVIDNSMPMETSMASTQI